MGRILVVVESPTKATIIQKYLREIDPANTYTVLASFGHIRDLPKGGIAVDARTLEVTYEVMTGKTAVLKKLRAAAKEADKVLLAADADREGESIAWHVAEVLRLPKKKMARITFTEITKAALKRAIENPRQIDMDLVMAQQSRRVLDRVVGYRVSPMLWREPSFSGMRGLSAGRVQSAALHLILMRDAERLRQQQSKTEAAVKAVNTWVVYADFDATASVGLLETTWIKEQFHTPETISQFYAALPSKFKITDISGKETRDYPALPFTTSTLQQAAVRALKWNAKDVMRVAQRLYESGHITYMRTDSTSMSPEAQTAIRDYVTETWGRQYVSTRPGDAKDKSKSKATTAADKKQNSAEGAVQGAHECIRPTRFPGGATNAGLEGAEAALYKLIYMRAVQSQMEAVVYQETTVTVNEGYQGIISVLKFSGWRITLGETVDADTATGATGDASGINAAAFTVGQTVKLKSMVAKWTRAPMPAPYTESSMVKAMETNGIGRPSTFSSTLETLYARGYVAVSDVVTQPAQDVTDYVLNKKTKEAVPKTRRLAEVKTQKALVATDLGKRVDTFLARALPDLVSVAFTAQMEADLDRVAHHTETYQGVIRNVCQRLTLVI